ncbi:MAG: hypothetical protein ACYC1K_01850 [Minisyncoccota bacterium]
MFAPRKVDLRLVVFFLLWTLHDKMKNQAIDKERVFRALRVLLVVLRAYFPKDNEIFLGNSKKISETFDEVVLEASFQEILKIAGGTELLFLTDHGKKLQGKCHGLSHNDHWALQTCSAVAVAAYENKVTVGDLLPPRSRA